MIARPSLGVGSTKGVFVQGKPKTNPETPRKGPPAAPPTKGKRPRFDMGQGVG
jgi:hypothetical protein